MLVNVCDCGKEVRHKTKYISSMHNFTPKAATYSLWACISSLLQVERSPASYSSFVSGTQTVSLDKYYQKPSLWTETTSVLMEAHWTQSHKGKTLTPCWQFSCCSGSSLCSFPLSWNHKLCECQVAVNTCSDYSTCFISLKLLSCTFRPGLPHHQCPGVRGKAWLQLHRVSVQAAGTLSVLQLSFGGWWVQGEKSSLFHLYVMWNYRPKAPCVPDEKMMKETLSPFYQNLLQCSGEVIHWIGPLEEKLSSCEL